MLTEVFANKKSLWKPVMSNMEDHNAIPFLERFENKKKSNQVIPLFKTLCWTSKSLGAEARDLTMAYRGPPDSGPTQLSIPASSSLCHCRHSGPSVLLTPGGLLPQALFSAMMSAWNTSHGHSLMLPFPPYFKSLLKCYLHNGTSTDESYLFMGWPPVPRIVSGIE